MVQHIHLAAFRNPLWGHKHNNESHFGPSPFAQSLTQDLYGTSPPINPTFSEGSVAGTQSSSEARTQFISVELQDQLQQKS